MGMVLVAMLTQLHAQNGQRIVPKAALPAGRPVTRQDLPTGQAGKDGDERVPGYQEIRIRNLVSNPDFEDENICTEYDKNCAPEGWVAISLFANYYFDELGAAAGGQHFLGLTAGSIRKPGARNFVRTRLLCAMQKGKVYRLEFYLKSIHPVLDSIGVYFSPDDFLYEKRSFKEIVPQLWTADAVMSEPDRNGWIKCTMDYTATGTEGYISFGHFRRNDITGVRRGDYNTDYYFFMDEVSLTPEDDMEMLCAAADSVRQNVYEENERHEYLNRKMYMMRKRSPVHQPLPPTINSEPEPAQVVDTLIIPDIFFATAKYGLLPSSHKLLDSFVYQLKPGKIDSIIVVGHTDSIGKFEYNQQLSENRANSVQQYLAIKQPLVAEVTRSRGLAFLVPVATNATAGGRRRNRRVEVFVYRKL